MRILITGGTGLIGRALIENLSSADHQMVVLSRNPARVQGMPPDVRLVQWDARTAAGWAEFADGAGAIVNLAGAGVADARWTAERKRTIRQSRLDAGAAVVEAVEQAGQKPGVVVQASAVGYYGPRGAEDITESAAPGDDFLAKVCIDWEASTAPVEAAGVRRAVIRIGIVLSPEGGALPRMMLPFKLFVGGPLGSGRQPFPWVHIEDVARAIRFLIETPETNGAFTLTAPTPPTNAEFSRALGRAMGRPMWLPVPGFALRLLFGEMAQTLLSGQRAVPERLQAAGFTFHFSGAEAALRDLLEPDR